MHKLIVFLLILNCYVVKADYGYMNLSTLVCNADYGAIGTIVAIDKSYFYLKVQEYVMSKLEFDTLKIQKFESWNCGKRYDKYEIGQKELVFFRKSNYVISDYDLLGYGGGGEFELPIRNDSIYYNFSFSRLKPYKLEDFITAIVDLDKIRQKTKETSKGISKEEQQSFAAKSVIHKLFIECKSYRNESEFEIPEKGYIANLEKNYLYQDYENKVIITDLNNDSVFLSVEDAIVWKQEQYFVVKPKDGWTRRWLNIYSLNDTNKSKVLFNQLFEIIELPEPRIYFGNYYSDTVHFPYYYKAMPSAAHYLDDMHKDKNLKYELLSYTYQINSGGRSKSYKVKSERGNNELREQIKKIQPGNSITIKDVLVLYPNNTVKKIKGRTVWVSNKNYF